MGTHLQDKVGRTLSERQARVAQISGLMPYIRQAARASFFDGVFNRMQEISYDWSAYEKHGEVIRSFSEFGGLSACPEDQKWKISWWLVMTYIGKPGGLTQYGNVRRVFYSNTAAPLIHDIVQKEGQALKPLFEKLRNEKYVKSAIQNADIAKRFESLVDLVDNN